MKTALASFCFVLAAGTSFAQVNDAQLWTGAGISVDITDDFVLSYEMQTRFYKNVTALDNYYNEIGAEYKLFKGFTTGIDYRYSKKNKEGYFETIHRFCLNAAYSYKLDDLGLRLKFRARYQVPFNRVGVVNENIYPDTKNTLRFKLTVNYTPLNFKMLQPFTSFEIYKGIKPVNAYNSIDSYRFTIGATLDLPKRHSIDLYYMLEKEYRAVQYNNHIWGIQYNYELFKDPVFDEPKTEEQ
jgi:hypothetical protein